MTQIIEALKVSQAVAAENQQAAQEKDKQYYNSNTSVPNFKPGDKVLLHNPRVPIGKAKKLVPKFEGPYYVKANGPNYTYYLKRLSDHKDHPSPVHANRLKPYVDPASRTLPDPPPTSITDTSGPNTTNESQPINKPPEWYPVEKILATKMMGSKRHYRVKWQGPDPPSWLPATDIAPTLIVEYHTKFTKTGKRRKRPAYKYFTPTNA